MEKVYVPFIENEPITVEVNGHRFLILASEEEDLMDQLEEFGDAEVREFDVHISDVAEGNFDLSHELTQISEHANAGVLVQPPGVSTSLLIESLESELPWLH